MCALVVYPLAGAVSDRTPLRFGRRSAWVAIGAVVGGATIIGGVAGNVVAARFADRIELGAIVFAAVLAAGATVFVLIGGEPRHQVASGPEANHVAQPTFAAFLVAAAIIGLGFGVYLAVGTALGTLVLPNPGTSGRDIGLIGLANASAQAVAPVAGSYLAAAFGYPVLFLAAAIACLVAGLAVMPIRSVP